MILRQYRDKINNGLSSEINDVLFEICDFINVKGQKNLVSIGQRTSDIYYVLKGGFVSQCFNEKHGKFHTVDFYLDDYQSYMSVLGAYSNNEKSSFQLKAFANSDVLVYQKDDLLALTEQSDEFHQFYYNSIISTIVNENKLRAKKLTLSSEEFYAFLLKEYLPIVKKVPSKYIAEYMGISPQWLSRIKHNYQS